MSTAASSRWPDLPTDLLHDILRRLHVADDYVRFHAVCRPWRDALPPPPCRPALLPWLLAPRDGTAGYRMALRIFSSNPTAYIPVLAGGWLANSDDGTAEAWPDNPDELRSWAAERAAAGAVSGDGTTFVYSFYDPKGSYGTAIKVALLHPGAAEWTLMHRKLGFTVDGRLCCVAYHDGRILVCCGKTCWCIATTEEADWAAGAAAASTGVHRCTWSSESDEPGVDVQTSYLVESRGELLWMRVRDNAQSGLSVSTRALRQAERGGEPRWVKMDGGGETLAGRALFLGLPSCFAVDAARLGIGGGCAYFIYMRRRRLQRRTWQKLAYDRCRLYRYSFYDDKVEAVKQLPDECHDEACMWLTPDPDIATTEETIARLGPLYRKAQRPQPQFGTYFGVYVGNLRQKVDSHRLRRFFSKHGKVTEATVILDRAGRSRGFGFVTMAATVDEKPENVIAKLNGKKLDRRPLQVKLADRSDGDQ